MKAGLAAPGSRKTLGAQSAGTMGDYISSSLGACEAWPLRSIFLGHTAQVFEQKDAGKRIYENFESNGGVNQLAQFLQRAPHHLANQWPGAAMVFEVYSGLWL